MVISIKNSFGAVLLGTALLTTVNGQANDKSFYKKLNISDFAGERKKFSTKFQYESRVEGPLQSGLPGIFEVITYPAKSGQLQGLISVLPDDGKKHPAIIWITGGDSNSVDGRSLFQASPRSNDQSAAAYRQAGLAMFFPTLRGGNTNPGKHEWFYGEVDDVIAAANYLASLPQIDPKRIYLGGHSTGATLSLLVAAASSQFRAIFAFGPVEDPIFYDPPPAPINYQSLSAQEHSMRAPIIWLPSIKTPVFVLEGKAGNYDSLLELKRWNKNPNIKFIAPGNADHFSILAPVNELIAEKILADTNPKTPIKLSLEEIEKVLNAK